jgi:hypothetical protein
VRFKVLLWGGSTDSGTAVFETILQEFTRISHHEGREGHKGITLIIGKATAAVR